MSLESLYRENEFSGLFFRTPTAQVADKIAGLEDQIIYCEMEIARRLAERETFIDAREKNLQLFWEKQNNLNGFEAEVQSIPLKKEEKTLLFRNLESVRRENKDLIEPGIRDVDREIEIIDGIVESLRAELTSSRVELGQWKAALSVIKNLGRAEERQEVAVPKSSGSPAA